MDEPQVITITLWFINDPNIIFFLGFLVIFLLVRTVKRSIPALLGGG